MSSTKRPTVTLSLDQVMELVDQLSPADALKVAKRMRGKVRSAAVEDLSRILSKVKMSEKEVTALVEEVRTERSTSQKVRSARR